MIASQTLHAVVFDMDDTLVDWSQQAADWSELRRIHLRPVHDHLRQSGHAVPDLERMAEVYSEINTRAWMSASPPDWYAPRQIDVLRAALYALSLNIDEAGLLDLQRRFDWRPVPGVRVFPEAVEVLRTIRGQGVRTGLLTNASSPMWMRDRELEALGLRDLLDERLTAGDIGHLKPHPRPFEAVLGRLNATASEAVFVGDRVQDDIVGAQSVGMRAVWIRRDGSTLPDPTRPDAVITDLRELLSILDQWFPGWR
jgi:putative hydrolase of the HAD superfamily